MAQTSLRLLIAQLDHFRGAIEFEGSRRILRGIEMITSGEYAASLRRATMALHGIE